MVMAKRLHKTLLDYLVIAISPAMIILLVDSLVLFLIQVFYRGGFQGRLDYVFTLFVIGAVLIGRISIEEGRERAVLFAVPLGDRHFAGHCTSSCSFTGPLASFSFLINCGLIALVWWSADKLVWDCTLIDEQEEDSGEGLLETIGLDRPDHAAMQREIAPDAQFSRSEHMTRRDAAGDHVAGRRADELVGPVCRTPPPPACPRRLGRLFFAGRPAAVRHRTTLYPERATRRPGSMRSSFCSSTRPADWGCCFRRVFWVCGDTCGSGGRKCR